MYTGSDYDYVICGGGQVGCVLASRLSLAGHTVALLEAGPEDYSDLMMSAASAAQLLGTDLEFNFKSAPQTHLNGRSLENHGGRLLSGSSGVNYGLWTRGHRDDYDAWATLVGDGRWSYERMLKYFKQVERHYDSGADPAKFGTNGPIPITAGARNYPLDPMVRETFEQSGHKFNPGANGGNNIGIGSMTENWRNGRRQPASKVFDLSRATVLTESIVSRIDIDSKTKRAQRVLLTNGRIFTAKREIIVCCGALKTPQLLMLSGIGPRQELTRLGIPLIEDLPVGQGLHDRLSLSLFWKLRNPEKGLAFGSPIFMKPEYANGNPSRWLVTASIPPEPLAKASAADGVDERDPSVATTRSHIEIIPFYAPVTTSHFHPALDGTIITVAVLALLPTSRGTVTLADTSPTSMPIVDPNYFATEFDREAMRSGMRMAIQAMETTPGKTMVVGEEPPPGFTPLTSSCSDADLDARVRANGSSFFQNAGTAAMGSVVDTECRVRGIQGLRVCDASVLPLPIAGHYMSPMYAFALAAADMILE